MTTETPEQARALAAALLAYADRVERGFDGDSALRAVCRAALTFTDDGDFYTLRDHLQFDDTPNADNIDDMFWRESAYAHRAGLGE